MKISKSDLRKMIIESMCEMDMDPYAKVSNMAPSVKAGPVAVGIGMPPNVEMDPDGYEGRMSKSNLFNLAQNATMLHNLLKDQENLEPWVQEKIAVASQMIDSIARYMQYEKIAGPQEEE